MLTKTARTYISVVVAAGALTLGVAAWTFHVTDTALFALLGAMAIIGSALKVKVPGVNSSLSVSFLPIILSTAILSLPETLAMTLAAAIGQTLFRVKKFRLVQAAFNCAELLLSAVLADLAAAALNLPEGEFLLVRLAASGAVFYLANAGFIATVIGLAEQRPLDQVWKECYYWSVPFFAAGTACVMMSVAGPSADTRHSVRYPGILLLALMLFVRHYYKLWVERTAPATDR